MEACAWWIEDDARIGGDMLEGFFTGRKHSGRCRFPAKFGDIASHFADSIFIDFHECYISTTNREANTTDA